MAYLAKTDYTRLIAINHLDEILAQAAETSGLTVDMIRTNAENMGIAEVRSYLNKRWDMTTEFAKTPSDTRNEMVIRAVLVIALYNLHFTINPRDIPEMREKSYTMMRQDLAAVRDGILDWDLPERGDTDGDGVDDGDPYGRVTLGSDRKFISNPFKDRTIIQ